MQRLLPIVLVVGLLLATAAAFAVTENLKLTKSPITHTQLQLKRFSPVCRCEKRLVPLAFFLRKRDVLTIDVVDARGRQVRQIRAGMHAHAKWNGFVWTGRTDGGRVAPDGTYQFRIKLAHQHRTILLPNMIVVDTHPARVLSAKPNRDEFSPDGDGQADKVKIRYTLSEPGHALLYVRGEQIVRTRSSLPVASLEWNGKLHGHALPQGTYFLRVGALDVAGNVTAAKDGALVVVHISYIALARHVIPGIAAGTRFGVGVRTAAAAYRWQLDGRSSRATGPMLILRAPKVPGRYTLVVSEHGNRDTATLVVVPRR